MSVQAQVRPPRWSRRTQTNNPNLVDQGNNPIEFMDVDAQHVFPPVQGPVAPPGPVNQNIPLPPPQLILNPPAIFPMPPPPNIVIPQNILQQPQLPPAPQPLALPNVGPPPIVEEPPEENQLVIRRNRQDNVNLRYNPLFEPHIHRINRRQMLPAPNQPEALPAIEQPLALPAPNQPLALPAPPQDINEKYNNAINLIDLYYNETSPRKKNQYGRRIRDIAKQFDIETKRKSLDWIISQIEGYIN